LTHAVDPASPPSQEPHPTGTAKGCHGTTRYSLVVALAGHNKHVPKLVETSHEGKETLLWNQQVLTNRTFPHNRLDIIRDSENGTCMLRDIAISGGRNMSKKGAKKILKYKDITVKIQCIHSFCCLS